MRVKMKLRNEYYDLVEVELPGKYEVCPNCNGKGTQVNPAIDGHGLSVEDFAEDPDFEGAYFSGVYDIPCMKCGGKRVVPVVDVSKCSFAEKRLLVYQRRWDIDEANYRAEVAAERRMGA